MFYSIKEISKLTGLQREFLYHLIRNKHLKHTKLSTRIFVKYDDLKKYFELDDNDLIVN